MSVRNVIKFYRIFLAAVDIPLSLLKNALKSEEVFLGETVKSLKTTNMSKERKREREKRKREKKERDKKEKKYFCLFVLKCLLVQK